MFKTEGSFSRERKSLIIFLIIKVFFSLSSYYTSENTFIEEAVCLEKRMTLDVNNVQEWQMNSVMKIILLFGPQWWLRWPGNQVTW